MKYNNVFEQTCPFQPQVNEIPEDMVGAKVYLEEDVFVRLSKPVEERGGVGLGSSSTDERFDKSNKDMYGRETTTTKRAAAANSAGAGGLGKDARDETRFDANVSAASSSSSPVDGGERRMTESEKAEIHRQFLLRQNEREEKRLNKLDFLEMKNAVSFEPALCTKSRKMVQKQEQRILEAR